MKYNRTMNSIALLLVVLFLGACSTNNTPVTPEITEEAGDPLDMPVPTFEPDILEAQAVSDLPRPGTIGGTIEGYARYDGEPSSCQAEDAALQPGPAKFKGYLAKFGIRASTYVPGCRDSFHGVGRALDIFISGDPDSGPAKQALANWFTANHGEMAKRLGIVQVIWNRRMWRSYDNGRDPKGGWGSYSGPNPHTDHVHISFSSAGAQASTSFFTKVIKSGSVRFVDCKHADGQWKKCALLRHKDGFGLAVSSPERQWVKTLQGLLNNRGIKDNSGHSLVADGLFGDKTLEAVRRAQNKYSLSVDGIVGTCTWSALLNNKRVPDRSGASCR